MPAVPQPAPRLGRPPSRHGAVPTAERILDAAEALFAERGYAGTTLRDVSVRVGIRTPSLYNHFDSKEALYRAVLARDVAPVLEALSRFLEGGPEALADPRQVIEQMMRLLARRPQLPRLVGHETLSGGEHLTPMLREWIEPIFARAHRMVEVSPRAARWEPELIPQLVLAIYNVVIGYFAVAPLYREMNGEDLLSEASLERQIRLLREMVGALFAGGDTSASPTHRPS